MSPVFPTPSATYRKYPGTDMAGQSSCKMRPNTRCSNISKKSVEAIHGQVIECIRVLNDAVSSFSAYEATSTQRGRAGEIPDGFYRPAPSQVLASHVLSLFVRDYEGGCMRLHGNPGSLSA